MEFCSPAKRPARVVQGQTDSVRRTSHGTPFRLAKRLTSRRSNRQMASPALTFLSPQTVFPSRILINMGTPKVSARFVPSTGNLEKSSKHVSTDTHFPPPLSLGNSSFELSPSLNLKMSGLGIEKRGSKRRCANDGLEEDVKRDFPMSRTCFLRSDTKRKKHKKLATYPKHGVHELERTYLMIDRWQEEMFQLQAKDWEYKRKHWVEQCHTSLWNVLKNPALLESTSSEMLPKTLVPINKLSSVDKHWLAVLVNSSRVEYIKCPEFTELTRDPREKKSKEEEFEFQMQFQFGFDVKDIEWYIHSEIGSKGINHYICGVIAEYIGHSKFLCDIQIYYKKSATPWWEQDGIAKMKYWSGEEYTDMIDFSPEAEVYFVQNWPDNSLVIDDYSDILLSDFQQLDEENLHLAMERKFITAVCCQIIHVCISKTPSPQSCAARNVLKQLSMIMKGWFIGVFLGEGICPDNLEFEFDTRAPCLAPSAGGAGESSVAH